MSTFFLFAECTCIFNKSLAYNCRILVYLIHPIASRYLSQFDLSKNCGLVKIKIESDLFLVLSRLPTFN